MSYFNICPECKSGKHRNCDGIADVDEQDNFIECKCDDGPHPLLGDT